MKQNIYCKECNSYFSQKYYNYHKKTLKHIENDIKYKSDEDIHQTLLNYLIVQLE
jgi:hypothetical protein